MADKIPNEFDYRAANAMGVNETPMSADAPPQVAPMKEYTPPVSASTGSSLLDKLDSFNHRAGAFSRGAALGLMSVGVGLGKAVVTGFDPLQQSGINKTLQSGYDRLASNVELDKAQYPKTTVAGELAGSLAAGLAIPGGSVTGKAASGVGDLIGPTSGIIGGFAKRALQLGAAGTAGAAQGGLLAGTMTFKGQNPSEVFNTDNAKVGAILGGTLGAAGELIGGRYADKVEQFRQDRQALNPTINGIKVQYTGPTFEGMDNFKNGIIGSKLAKINGYFGNDPYIQNSKDQVTQALSGFIESNAKKYPNAGLEGVTKIVDAGNKRLLSMEKQAWEPITAGLKGLTQTRIVNTAKNDVDTILNTSGMSNMVSSKVATDLSNIDNLSPSQVLSLKRDIGSVAHKLNISKNLPPEQMNVKNTFNSLYNNLNKDLESVMPDDLLEQYHIANSVTASKNQFLQLNPQLRKAIASVNSDQQGVQTWLNYMLRSGNSGPSASKMAQNLNFIGEEGKQQLQSVGLKRILDSASDPVTGHVNLNKLIGNLQNTQNSSVSPIYKDTVSQLQGLLNLGKNALASSKSNAPEGGVGVGGVVTGGLGALGLGKLAGADMASSGGMGTIAAGGVAGVGLTGAALGAFTRAYSPVKRLLTSVSKVDNSTNPTLRQYMFEQTVKNLNKIGVVFKTLDDGSIVIDTKASE